MKARQRRTLGETSPKSFYATNEGRDLLAELANQVEDGRMRIAFGSRKGRPVYELIGASSVERATLDACLKIGIDEARRNWTSVRAVVRAVGGLYLLVVKGEPRAVLRRHPDFDARLLDAHASYFLQRRQGDFQPDLVARIERLERLLDDSDTPAKRRRS
jgi:hypothetical protein